MGATLPNRGQRHSEHNHPSQAVLDQPPSITTTTRFRRSLRYDTFPRHGRIAPFYNAPWAAHHGARVRQRLYISSIPAKAHRLSPGCSKPADDAFLGHEDLSLPCELGISDKFSFLPVVLFVAVPSVIAVLVIFLRFSLSPLPGAITSSMTLFPASIVHVAPCSKRSSYVVSGPSAGSLVDAAPGVDTHSLQR